MQARAADKSVQFGFIFDQCRMQARAADKSVQFGFIFDQCIAVKPGFL